MKKFGNWVLNHLVLSLAIVVFGVTFIVVGSVMLHSRISYARYEKNFNQNDLDIRSLSGAQPNYIEFNDSYKSNLKKKLALSADELTVTTNQSDYLVDGYIDLGQSGGTISAKLELEEKSFVDIDFEIATEYENASGEFGVKDLLSNVQFIVNGETMEEQVDLVESGWHHLVMVNFALPEGEVNVQIKSMSGKNALMPQLKGITFFSSAKLAVAEAE